MPIRSLDEQESVAAVAARAMLTFHPYIQEQWHYQFTLTHYSFVCLKFKIAITATPALPASSIPAQSINPDNQDGSWPYHLDQ